MLDGMYVLLVLNNVPLMYKGLTLATENIYCSLAVLHIDYKNSKQSLG